MPRSMNAQAIVAAQATLLRTIIQCTGRICALALDKSDPDAEGVIKVAARLSDVAQDETGEGTLDALSDCYQILEMDCEDNAEQYITLLQPVQVAARALERLTDIN